MSETTNTASGDAFASQFPNPSPQLQVVIHHLRGIMKQDVQHHLTDVTDDFKWELVTHGFDALGPRVRDRAQTEKFMDTLYGKSIKSIQFYAVKDYIEMPGKILLHMRASGEFATAVYDDDQAWIFHLSPGPDPKINYVKTFFDSHYAIRIVNDLIAILKDSNFELP